MGGLSIWHWLIVILFVMILFGRGKISDMMGDVGKGLKSFKEGMADEEDDKRKAYEEQRRADPPRQLPRDETRAPDPIDVTPRSAEPSPLPPRDDEAR